MTTEGGPEERARACIAAGDAPGVLAALPPLVHLNAHDPDGPGCLCPRCFGALTLTHGGETFTLDLVSARGRALFYWLPAELADEPAPVRDRVRARLDALVDARRDNPERDLLVTPWRLRAGR